MEVTKMSTLIYAIIIIVPSIALGFMAYSAFKSHLNGVGAKKIMKKNLLSSCNSQKCVAVSNGDSGC